MHTMPVVTVRTCGQCIKRYILRSAYIKERKNLITSGYNPHINKTTMEFRIAMESWDVSGPYGKDNFLSCLRHPLSRVNIPIKHNFIDTTFLSV